MSYVGRKVELTQEYIGVVPEYVSDGKNIGIVIDDTDGLTGCWEVQMDNGTVASPYAPEHEDRQCILLEETNQEALDRLQLQPGDIVKVLSNDNTGGGGWIRAMEECMGKPQEIREIRKKEGTVSLYTSNKKDWYWYRPQILEVISRASTKQERVQEPAIDNHTILDTAKSLIYGDREKEYGKAIDNIGNIAKMWSILLQKEITMEQVLDCMIAVKQCRLINQPNHTDSWIDICGYAALKEKIDKEL